MDNIHPTMRAFLAPFAPPPRRVDPQPVEEICDACSGSGEGRHEGTTCYSCGGTGIERVSE